MAGLINKIGDALHIGGGNKEGEHKKHEEEHKKHVDEHKSGEHKEGIADKIKDKIHGGEGKSHDGEKKKKKDKKEKKHHGDGHHSSSSDSDSD
ncbi:PREDICTED: dehydrin HIRD11-like [Camelina sativa]|uniref:Dehydrin HIRD11-like n=1 Tax=Camelina sativa TaxID=90675 RepID=A0ABM0WFG6_CAMSA|nr:PREDICTED: dehydrin HIRD11-like [Camelina sativa]